MRRRTAVAFAFFLALSALFWWPTLIEGRALFYDTLLRVFYPDAVLFHASLRRGVLPFWDPYLYSGVPFLANPQSALFYPFTYLYAVFSFSRATAIFVWLQSALAAVFMCRLCLEMDVSMEGSLVAGAIYAFNGFFVNHYAYPSHFASCVWLPLIALLVRKTAMEKSWRAAAAAGFALALEIFAGHPQFAFYTVLAAAVFTLCDQPNLNDGVLALAGAGFFGAAFSAIQWAPFLSFMMKTPRLAGQGFAWATGYSLHPKDLLRMLAFPLWNRYFTLRDGDPHILGIYFGLAALALAAAGLFAGRRARGFSLLALGGFFLALGRYEPLYAWLYRGFFPLRWIRFPAQALFLSCFGAAGLAGLGLDRTGLGRAARLGAVALVILDLWFFSRAAIITISPAVYQARLPTPAALRNWTGADYRIMMTPKTRQTEAWRGTTVLNAWLGFRDSLSPNMALAEGLRDVGGDDEMHFARYDRVLDEIAKSPASPWIAASSIRYALSFWDMPAPKFRLVREGSIRVYENTSALPRAYYSQRAIHVDDDAQLAYLDSHPGHDLRAAILWDGPSDPAALSRRARQGFDQTPVKIVAENADAVTLEVSAPKPGWVALTDTYAPGWSAQVNGMPERVCRVNYFQRGVRVGAGISRLEMRYRPPYFRLGAIISLTSGLLTLAALAVVA